MDRKFFIESKFFFEKNLSERTLFLPRHLIISIIGLQEISSREKLSMGFMCYDPDQTGFINIGEMTKIIQVY